jgi:hypothetical protein
MLLWHEAFRNPHWFNFAGALVGTLFLVIESTLVGKFNWRPKIVGQRAESGCSLQVLSAPRQL